MSTKNRRRYLTLAFGLLLVALSIGASGEARQRPSAPPRRVAVFAQPGFPFYGVSALVSPKHIAEALRTAGIPADTLDTDALMRPDKFNARTYAAVLLPYGNTYPKEAFANLRAFHRAGGSLVTTGIPFTHGVARVAARGWSAVPEWGPSVQIATGAGPEPGTSALRIHHRDGNWTGASSSRFPVRTGDVVQVSASVRDDGSTPETGGATAAADTLYVRFFDASGGFLRQEGVPLTLATASARWTLLSAGATAPTGATQADLSLQLQHPGRRILAGAFSAKVNGKSVNIPNARLTPSPNEFSDLGHRDETALWGPAGIGIGGFAGPDSSRPVPFTPLAGDPLGLARLTTFSEEGSSESPQWLNPATIPAGVRLVPLVGEASRPLLALIVHERDEFAGAVDAWTYRPPHGGEREPFDSEQMMARATVAVLARRNVLTDAERTAALRRLDALPGPTVYAGLTLPTPPRQYSTFQPKMPPPARHLYVADVRNLTADERVLLQSLQGIVNRKQPRIYLIYDDADRFWLTQLQAQKETDAPIPVADAWSLVKQFGGECKGVVLTDPKVYESACIAVSLAGADDLLVARTPELAKRTGLPIKTDLRGKFKNNADALRYLRTELLPRLDPYLTCSLDPAVYDRGALDNIIAARGSFFWITGPKAQNLPGADQAGEMEEVRALFAQMPLGAVVRGFWWHGDGVGLQEGDGVTLGSRFGKVTLVSDLITNLSVHSGVKADKLMQKPRPPAPTLDRSKVYLAFTMSDGDNLCTWRDYFRKYFTDPVRGSFPVGWGMGPGLRDLAPDWARWYYENATPNDEFICDVSGVAYMYPSSWGTALKDRDAAFRWFYGKTAEYMGLMDMKSVRLMDVRADDIARVGPLLPGVDFLLPDYGHAGVTDYAHLTYSLPDGQAVFRAITSGSGPENLARQIRERAGTARPAFVNAFIWNWGSSLSDLKRTLEILGPDYVAVTPSQLNALYRDAQK